MALDLNQLRQEYPAMKDAEDDDILEFIYNETGANKTGSFDDFKEFMGHSPKETPKGDTRSLWERSIGPIVKPAAGILGAGADLIGAVPGMLGFTMKGAEALTSPITGKPIEKSLEEAQSFAHSTTPTVAAGLEEYMAKNPAYQDLFAKPMGLIDKFVKGTANVAGEATGSDPVRAGTELAILGGLGAVGAKGSAVGAKAKGRVKADEILGKNQRDIAGGDMNYNEALNAIWKKDQKDALDAAIAAERQSTYGGVAEPGIPVQGGGEIVGPRPQPQVRPQSPMEAMQGPREPSQGATTIRETNAARQAEVQGMSPVEAMIRAFEQDKAVRMTEDATAARRQEGRQATADRVMDVENLVKQGLDHETPVETGPGNTVLEGILDQIKAKGEKTAERRAVEEPLIERMRQEQDVQKTRELEQLARETKEMLGMEHLKVGEASIAMQEAAARAPTEVPKETTGFGELLKERQETNQKLMDIDTRLEELVKENKLIRETRDNLQKSNPEMVRDIKDLSRRARETNSEIQTLRRQKTDITRRPISSSGKMGRQRGAVNFFRDEKPKQDTGPTQEFIDKLPPSMKERAGELWKRFNQATNEAQNPTEAQLHVDGPARTALDKTPGLQRIKDLFAPETVSAEQIIPMIKESIDPVREGTTTLGKMGRGVQQGIRYVYEAGGQLGAFASENVGRRWGAAHIQEAVRGADKLKKEFVRPVMDAFDALRSREFTEVFKTILDNEGTLLSPERLTEMKLSPKQIKAYNAWQIMAKGALDRMNALRRSKGKEDIEGVEGHFPHLFYGDYKSFIKNADGNVLYVVSAKTSAEVNTILKSIKDQTGLKDITTTTPEKVSLSNYGKRTSDHLVGMSELLQYFEKGSEEGAAIRAAMDSYLSQRGYKSRGMTHHFKGRSEVSNLSPEGEAIQGVQGYVGKRSWLDEKTNAREGVNAAIRYYERVMEWEQMQRAQTEIGKVLSDPELQSSHPNTLKDIRMYMDNYTGARFNRDGVIESVLQSAALKKAGAEFSNVMRGIVLGNNPAFFFSQVLQTINMVPAYLSMISKQGGPEVHAMKAVASATQDLGWAYGGKARTAVGREAAKVAEEYGFTDSHFRDEIQPALATTAKKVYHGAMNWAMEIPDTFTRRVAFMTFYHAFHDAGLRGKDLSTAAANATDMSMVNYRPQERAQVFQDFGAIGQSLGALRSFLNNQVTNTYALGKINGAISVPFLTAIGSQLALGGLLGFYGMDEVKRLWTVFQGIYDNVTDKRMPSIEEFILSSGITDYVTFGVPSAATGLDLSSKFSAANLMPDNAGEMAPYFGAFSTAAPAIWDLIKHPNKANLALALRAIPNAQTMAIGENMMTKDGMLLKKDLSGGDVRRTTEDQIIRHLGTRTIAESKEQRFNRFEKENVKWGNEGKKTARSNDRKNRMDSPNVDIREVQRYLNHGGTVEGYMQQLLKNEQDKYLTEEQRGVMQQFRKPTLMENAPERRR